MYTTTYNIQYIMYTTTYVQYTVQYIMGHAQAHVLGPKHLSFLIEKRSNLKTIRAWEPRH